MPSAPAAFKNLPFAELFGSTLGAPGQEKEEGSCWYAVPKGCMVRNTFLEWQECDGEGSPHSRGGSHAPRPRCAGTQARARSCPEKALAGRLPRRRSHHGRPVPPSICTEWSEDRTAAPIPGKGSSPSADDVTAAVGNGLMHRGVDMGFYHAADVSAFTSASLPVTPMQGQVSLGTPSDMSSWLGGWAPHTPPEGRSPGSLDARGYQKPHKGWKFISDQASLVLRGLPFSATVADIVTFIEQAGVSQALAPGQPISLLVNQQGRPSGFAEIQLACHADFWKVQEKLHMQRLGGRYIEALPPRNGKPTGAVTPASRHRTKRDSWRRCMM